jgi:hypothetical protein
MQFLAGSYVLKGHQLLVEKFLPNVFRQYLLIPPAWGIVRNKEPPFLTTVVIAWNDTLRKSPDGRQTLLAIDANKHMSRCNAISV